jgi:hypothetical protein
VTAAYIRFDVLVSALKAQAITRGMEQPHFAALSPTCREYGERTPVSYIVGDGWQTGYYAMWWTPRRWRRHR